MRCLALAQAWKGQVGAVVFLSSYSSEVLIRRIRNEGFELLPIEPPPGTLSTDPDNTLNRLADMVSESASDQWVVLDGYHFSPQYQKTLQDAGYRLLVIDDYNHQPRYYADILLNQNIDAEHVCYTCNNDTLLLLGTRYVLLRSEFLRSKRAESKQPPIARKILVTLGGADPDNVTLKVVQALRGIDIPGLEAKVVIGPANPNRALIQREVKTSRCASGLRRRDDMG